MCTNFSERSRFVSKNFIDIYVTVFRIHPLIPFQRNHCVFVNKYPEGKKQAPPTQYKLVTLPKFCKSIWQFGRIHCISKFETIKQIIFTREWIMFYCPLQFIWFFSHLFWPSVVWKWFLDISIYLFGVFPLNECVVKQKNNNIFLCIL